MSANLTVTLTVNGREIARTAGGHLTLLRWLREVQVSSCLVLAAQVDGATVTTAAGLTGPDGTLNPLQQAFHEHHAAQCGFCTPGMLMAAAAMLADGRTRTRAEIRQGLHGNLCRCTGYGPIVDAIEATQLGARQHGSHGLGTGQPGARQQGAGW